MAFGELLLSAFLQVAFDRLVPRKFKAFARLVQVDSDLEELEETMLLIQGVLHDAEQKQITNPAMRLWLDKLTHLALDIEDLLDEVATHAHRLKQEEETQPNTDQVRELVSSLRNFWSKAKESGKIKTLIERLDKVWLQGQRLGLSQGVSLAQISTSLIQRPPTTSLPLDSHVYGREKDVEQLLELLLSDGDDTGSNNVSVIPIMGMGGVGKTTLAQLLYNHEDVKEHFTLKAWACVSDAKFDVVRVTKEILESATKDSFTVNGLQQLQERLKEVLGEKKFLLVLDDVWSEDYNDWDRLRAPFRGGPNGSKIIVTTRSENVSSIMRTIPTFHLKELSEEDCQALFFHHAFQNLGPDEYPELKPIGEKIVKKCKGLPLAAKTLGGLLRCNRDATEWEGLLSSEIWDQTQNTSGILPSLALSYHYLPAQLKRCFSYCAMFPQDYVFNKEKLILLWMAEGFLQSKGNRRMEDTGDEYFRELLSRSFFQRSGDHESRFVMHDLIHDLARSVCREICFSLRDEQEDNNSSKVDMSLIRYTFIPEKDYHLMSKFKVFQETKSLRALLLLHSGRMPYYGTSIPRQLLCFLFSVLPCLRVLCVSGVFNCYELPESIGDLMHLRYLNLSQTSIESLPNSLCKLWNLQTLLLSNCKLLRELPSEMSNLTELRHLHIDGCEKLEKMPVRMNKLTNLQTLPLFVVGKNSGSSIQALKDVKQLREKLRIIGLRSVDKIDGSLLGNKEHLHELELSWESTRANIATLISEPVDEGKETAVIKELQPHTNLKRLSVRWYHGKTFPSWLGSSSYSQLVNLELLGCRRCQLLPPLGCLPFLRYLLIEGLQGVKSVGAEFYGSVHASKLPFQSLETLIFRDMEYWEEWFGIEEEGEEVFPILCELEISNCPKLRKFSHPFVKLKKLKIKNCNELIELPRCLPVLCRLEAEGCEAMVLRSLIDSTRPLPLSFLSISRISNLEYLLVPHKGEGRSLLGCLNALRELEIEGCDDLVKLLCSDNVRSGIQCLASLLSLKISKCRQLLYLTDDEDMLPLNSVTCLKISSCPSLHFLKFPSQVETVCIRSCHSLKIIQMMPCTSLRELTISNLPGLPSPGEKMVLPSTIRKLEIRGCGNLEIFPELMVHSNNDGNNSFLDRLRIYACRSLTSFTERGASSSTGLPLLPKCLEITDCKNLTYLFERMMYSNRSLEHLQIEGCGELKSFPSGGCLRSTDHPIVVDGNMNGSSSNQYQNRKISGLHAAITNFKSIEIADCPLLNSLPHYMYNLTSLQSLSIFSCPSLVSFPEGGLSTSTLAHLFISYCENLRSLPDGLHKAMSLRDLSITGCPNLDPFPKGVFLAT